jgi:hypothetical protein
MGTGGSFTGGKVAGREADHSPPTTAEVKTTWIHTYNSPYSFLAMKAYGGLDTHLDTGTTLPYTVINASLLQTGNMSGHLGFAYNFTASENKITKGYVDVTGTD